MATYIKTFDAVVEYILDTRSEFKEYGTFDTQLYVRNVGLTDIMKTILVEGAIKLLCGDVTDRQKELLSIIAASQVQLNTVGTFENEITEAFTS